MNVTSVLPPHQSAHNMALADTLDRIATMTEKLAVLCDEAYEQMWRMDNISLCNFLNEVGDYDTMRLFELHNHLATGCNLVAEFIKSDTKCQTAKPEGRFTLNGHIFCPIVEESA